jgi:hypothetical protein
MTEPSQTQTQNRARGNIPLPASKATSMDINFRKIDIDVYDEDVLLETELYDPDPRGPQQVLEDAKAKAASVRTSLAK